MSLCTLSSYIHRLKPSPPCSDENRASGEPSSLRWPGDDEWLSGLLRWVKIPQLLPKQADFNQMALERTDLAIALDIIKSWMKTAPLLRTYIIIAPHLTRHRVCLNCVGERGSVVSTQTPIMEFDYSQNVITRQRWRLLSTSG